MGFQKLYEKTRSGMRGRASMDQAAIALRKFKDDVRMIAYIPGPLGAGLGLEDDCKIDILFGTGEQQGAMAIAKNATGRYKVTQMKNGSFRCETQILPNGRSSNPHLLEEVVCEFKTSEMTGMNSDALVFTLPDWFWEPKEARPEDLVE